MSRKHAVAVVGTGYSEIARYSDKSLGQLTVDAAVRAAADAGINIREIDGLANYPNPSRLDAGGVEGVDIAGVNFLAQVLPLEELHWTCSITQGAIGASLVEAAHAVAAGACKYALVWRSMHNPRGKFNVADIKVAEGIAQYTAPYGLVTPIMRFSMTFSRYLAKFGRTRDDLATFIVNNRAYAADNPDSIFFGKKITVQDYLDSPIVSSPLGYLDCDMPVDGCGALIVTRAEIAKDLRLPPAYIGGAASLGIERRHSPIMTYESFFNSAEALASTLWDQSGFRPSDMRQVSLYDSFSFFVPILLEAFGYCPAGEGIDFINDGHTQPGGTYPLNTSGGALGMGRMHGTPQVIEAARQVQGACGDRQVPGVTNALAVAGGTLTGAGAVVFSRNAAI